jgi:transposase
MKEHRKYNPELKTEAIKMVVEQGMSQADVGQRLSIPKGTIGNWLAGYMSGKSIANPGDQSTAELRAENIRLRKELAESRMERKILKKATAYFARESLPGTRS